MKTTGKDFVDHWTWAAEKGLMNTATAASLKSACIKILGVLDDWETIDVRNLDVGEVIHRFQNLKARDFTPSSLETYASRFRKALTLFLEYAANPAGWRVAGRSRRQKSNEKILKNDKAEGADGAKVAIIKEDARSFDEPNLISYPFPLRRGLTVKLSLPEDLTSTEARRLSAFMMTLSSEFTGDDE